MSIRVRQATPADEAAIDRWQRSLENLDEFISPRASALRDPETVRRRFAEWLQRPRAERVLPGYERVDLVALEESGAICGYASVLLGPVDALTGLPEALLTELHIWPEFRRPGVARGLLDMAEAAAAQRGVPFLTVQIPAGDGALQKLVQEAGFRAETVRFGKRTGEGAAG